MGTYPPARKYSQAFKAEALAYLEATGYSVPKVAAEFDINPETLKSWFHRRGAIIDSSTAAATNAYRRGWQAGRKATGKPLDLDFDGEELAGPVPESMLDIVQRSEMRKLELMTKVEDAVELMVQRLMEEVEHAEFSQLVDAINLLLDRVEAMTYRPRAENREDFLAMMSGLQPREPNTEGESEDKVDVKLEHAVAEALRRRGHLNGSSDADS